MADPEPSSQAAPPSPPKRRGCFGLAFKGVLGCAAFAIGAIAVLIVFLPSLCGGLFRSAAEQVFDGQFQGSLTIAEVDLAWKSQQRIQDAVLFDPDKREVARVSAVLPSILDLIGNKPLRATLTVDADLVADDQGVSNLQRSLELREPRAKSPKRSAEQGSDPFARLASLDAEIEVVSHHLTWSDAETRRKGAPFEVRDLKATARAKPGEPLSLRAGGQVVSDPPGVLEIDATVHGPIEVGKAWPLGAVDAKVRVEGFSTAMVDGVANLGGKLTEVLGSRFDLKVSLAGATPQQGDLELQLASERTNLDFAGRFEGGFLRTRDGSPVRLALGVPRGFVNGLLTPALPPGTSIAWEESEKPWTVSVEDLSFPVPDAGALDAKGLAKTLEHLECRVNLDLPARIRLESAELRAVGVRAGLEGLHATLSVAPGQPAGITFGAKVLDASNGSVDLSAQVHEPWKALAEGSLPDVAGSVHAHGIPTAGVDAVLGQGGSLTELLGPRFRVTLERPLERPTGPGSNAGSLSLDVAAGEESGQHAYQKFSLRVDARLQAGVLLCRQISAQLEVPRREWLDSRLASVLPAGTKLTLAPGAIEISGTEIVVPLRSPPLRSLEDEGLAFDVKGSVPGLEITKESEGAPASSIALRQVTFGAKLAAGPAPKELEITLEAAVASSQSKVSLSATLHEPKRILQPQAKGLTSVDADLSILGLSAIAPAVLPGVEGFLPKGSRLELPADVRLSLRGISLPRGSAGPSGASTPPEGLSGVVTAKVDQLGYEDEHTRAAKVDLALRQIDVTVEIAPKKPLAAKLSALVATRKGGEPGKLDADLSLAAGPSLNAEVRLAGLPTESLDALAGRPGLVSGLLGPLADLRVAAEDASANAGSFSAQLTSPTAALHLVGRLEKGTIVSGKQPLLDGNVPVSQAWLAKQVIPLLPAGAQLSIPPGSGPLQLTVRDARIPLPQASTLAQTLPLLSLHMAATAPSLSYSDTKTAAAGAPATVRDLSLEIDLAPGQLLDAKLSAKIEGEPAGEIRASVRALDSPAILAEEKGLDRFRIAADVNAKGVPTGLVDALAAQAGLLVDVLGPRLDLTLHTDSISKADGTFTADLHSDQADVHCDRGGMKDGVLYLEKVQGKNEALLARVGLTPMFSERVVGSLVPTLVNLSKPQGSDPVSLSVDELRLPFDADLSKLDAIVRLDLGEVTYRLLPGLDSLLGKSDAKSVRLPELRVPIQKGIASYDGLPVRIGGRDYAFKGTFSLVDKSFKMETQVPLAVLGKGVSDKLDGLRGILDSNTMVPLELRGTWKSPKLRIGDDFLKKIAEDALKKQGGNLLEGLLKKKN